VAIGAPGSAAAAASPGASGTPLSGGAERRRGVSRDFARARCAPPPDAGERLDLREVDLRGARRRPPRAGRGGLGGRHRAAAGARAEVEAGQRHVEELVDVVALRP
jgi:hypothetical protein